MGFRATCCLVGLRTSFVERSRRHCFQCERDDALTREPTPCAEHGSVDKGFVVRLTALHNNRPSLFRVVEQANTSCAELVRGSGGVGQARADDGPGFAANSPSTTATGANLQAASASRSVSITRVAGRTVIQLWTWPVAAKPSRNRVLAEPPPMNCPPKPLACKSAPSRCSRLRPRSA